MPRVLVVCTANICRSPTAERLLASRVGPGITFLSRGTDAVDGAPICGVSGNWLATRRAFGSGRDSVLAHTATQLAATDLDGVDLVLTATEAHRDRIVGSRPSVQASTFTLLEAARIARWVAEQSLAPPDAADPAERLTWLVAALRKHRLSTPAADPATAVPEPHRGPSRTLLGRLSRRPPARVVGPDDLYDPHEGGEHPPMLRQLEDAVRAVAAPLRPRP